MHSTTGLVSIDFLFICLILHSTTRLVSINFLFICLILHSTTGLVSIDFLFICLNKSLMLNSQVSSAEWKVSELAMLRSLMKVQKSKQPGNETYGTPYFIFFKSELKTLIGTNWDSSLKDYLCYKLRTSQNVSSKVLVKNFLIS